MKAEAALDLFRGRGILKFRARGKFNCTQAVLKAFQLESGISEETIQTAALQGGGRAPEGVCGALHAARVILGNAPALEEIENDFSSKAGSKQCREIRGMRSLSCSGCVTLSAYLLEQHNEK
jgi:hypothetical protein